MPKKKAYTVHKPVYWWSSDINALRNDCVHNIKLYTRKTSIVNPETIKESWDTYQKSRKILRNTIKKVKRSHWRTLCDLVNYVIWRHG